ncbi:DUF948 domain-containing protein [Pseudalkalibacillus salsuginis]|uniref:DUF948 domain-containing protein n=1 Tax=Pseudalkalibacillus salsuginis TaxID=2910972 RepID=UPI001F253AAA|nr:DUF948 domain-containing protein [Pseudalkalibacillus salsuginis]MCF6408162.1 DUF948 domain-containing protein [Pseudalkalibacillus salsuginis]
MFVYIGVLLIALSFTTIVIYLVRLLNGVTNAVKSLDHSAEQLEGQLERIAEGLKPLVQETSLTIDDVQYKLNSTSGLIQSLKNVGEILNLINQTINRSTDHFSSHVTEQSSQIAKIMKWGNAAYHVYGEKRKRNW